MRLTYPIILKRSEEGGIEQSQIAIREYLEAAQQSLKGEEIREIQVSLWCRASPEFPIKEPSALSEKRAIQSSEKARIPY